MTVKDHAHTHEAELAETLKQHHARMVAELDRLSAEFAEAAANTDPTPARRALTRWIDDVLVPHAAEEELTTYRAAAALPSGRLLIDAMMREHVLIRRLAAMLKQVGDPTVSATYGRAVFEIFDSHQRKENEIILPLLATHDSVSLVEVMSAGRHAHDERHDQHDHH